MAKNTSQYHLLPLVANALDPFVVVSRRFRQAK
jgi:hypothetical protein